MIKVCIFNKSNNVSRFDSFKMFFHCINSKISLTCCTETGVLSYQTMLDSERRMANLTIRCSGLNSRYKFTSAHHFVLASAHASIAMYFC